MQGNSNGYYKVIGFGKYGNYAVFLSQDFTVITCEKTELNEGIYNQDGVEESDPEIIKSIETMFGIAPTDAGDGAYSTLQEMIEVELSSIVAEQIAFNFVDLLPKFNKTIINGLDNLGLNIIIDNTEKDFPMFCCVGANEYYYNNHVLSEQDILFISPSRFYLATNYEKKYSPDNIYMRKIKRPGDNYFLLFANADILPDKVALCGGINREKFFRFQKELVELE